MAMPSSETSVSERTAERVNERIRREMEARIFYYAQNPAGIGDRLTELDQEWDIERMLEVNAAGFALLGIILGRRHRKWLMLPFAVSGFLMLHALQCWRRPMEICRRWGIRTTKEINAERYALKVLKGDFDNVNISRQATAEEKTRMALNALKDGGN